MVTLDEVLENTPLMLPTTIIVGVRRRLVRTHFTVDRLQLAGVSARVDRVRVHAAQIDLEHVVDSIGASERVRQVLKGRLYH